VKPCHTPPIAAVPLLLVIWQPGSAGTWDCQSSGDNLWDCRAGDSGTAERLPAAEPALPVDATTDPSGPEEPPRIRPESAPEPPVPPDAKEATLSTLPAPGAGTAGTSTTADTPQDTASGTVPVVPATAPSASPPAAMDAGDPKRIRMPPQDAPTGTARDSPGTSSSTPAATADRAANPQDSGTRENPWSLCPPVATTTLPLPADATASDTQIHLAGDTAEVGDETLYTLQGNAVVTYGTRQVNADTLIYDQEGGTIDASGDLHYRQPDLALTATRARLYPDEDRGELHNVDYVLPDRHGRGTATVVNLDGKQRQHLEQASFTTCPRGETPDWELSASRLDLDEEEGMGVAHHARLALKDVPVLYTPYISFPIDDRRRTGFLIPKIGTSEETGFDLSVPYYLNLAPNYDATLTPRYMSDRGLQMGGEFRYLHRHNSGQLSGEYLPSDNRYDNRNRHLVAFEHNGNPFPRLTTSIDAADVSDKDYFEDLGGDLVNSSRVALKREADVVYHGNRWRLDTRVLDFQTVDPTIPAADRPYKELPRIRLNAAPDWHLAGLRFSMDSEATEFKKDQAVTGRRVDLLPRISLPVERAAYYIKPTVGLRHTLYRLDDTEPGDPDDPERTTAIASLDSGLFFDRNARWGSTDYIQTLEPRLFYLFVPNKDQNDIPVFDTGTFEFNFWQLFLENRFSGPDRMGDANQVAVAMTTRLLDPATGVQRLSASLGELVYFRDRKVTLPDEPVQSDNSSAIIGEVDVTFSPRWRSRAEFQWNPGETHTDVGNVLLQYRADKRQLANLSYRYRRQVLNQTDVSFLYPLGQAWHVVGRWNYSIKNRRTLETLGGVGYESCCWNLQVVGRSYVNNKNGGRTTGIYLQAELKGLTGVGSQVDSVLEHGILDYDSEY
jgi:LPS-assembly protein